MVKVEHIIVAQDALMDERNRVSIIGISDQMHTVGLPANLQGVTVVAKIRADESALVNRTLHLKVAFEINGKEISKAELKPRVTIEKDRAFGPIIKLDNVIFPEFGNYSVVLYIDGKRMADTIFAVRDQSELAEK